MAIFMAAQKIVVEKQVEKNSEEVRPAGNYQIDFEGNVKYRIDGEKYYGEPSDLLVVKDEKEEEIKLDKVTGLKAGKTKLSGSIDGYSCDFTITVYPETYNDF